MSVPIYKVNLLPPKLQREELVDVRRLSLIIAVMLLIVVVLGTTGFFILSYLTMRNDIAAATQELASLQPTVAYVENLHQQRVAMQSTAADYKALLQKNITWSSLLSELDDIAPADVWLVELDIVNTQLPGTQAGKAAPSGAAASSAPSATPTAAPGAATTPTPRAGASVGGGSGQAAAPMPPPNTVTIKGYSLSVTAIGIFEKNLNQLPYFKNVVLKSIGSQDAGGNTTNSQNGVGSSSTNPQAGVGSSSTNSQTGVKSFEITAYLKDESNG
jgi:Tfp pilus assembly protein PilN